MPRKTDGNGRAHLASETARFLNLSKGNPMDNHHERLAEREDEMPVARQIASKMIEANDMIHAVCLNEEMRGYGWVHYRHADGQWVTLRKATDQEIHDAKRKLDMLIFFSTIPTESEHD